MEKSKTMQGVKVIYKGEEVKKVEPLYYDSYDGKMYITYKEDENTYINIKCEPKDIEMKAE